MISPSTSDLMFANVRFTPSAVGGSEKSTPVDRVEVESVTIVPAS